MKAELGTWTILLKLGSREHLERFRCLGELYMNSLNYFARLEGDEVRGDEFEGISMLFQPANLQMVIEGPAFGKFAVDPADLCGPVRVSRDVDRNANAFCMYAITAPVDGDFLDSRCEDFGDSLVIVLDGPEFLRRIAAEATARGLFCEAGLVKYYDCATHQGKLSPFHKINAFSYQQEFRIVARSGAAGPLIMQIGDLRDITSEILPMSERNDHINFSWDSAREAGYA